VKLIIQPDDGLTPLLQAVRHAKTKIDILIFRFDRAELEDSLEAAVARGVVVRALIAHTNRGGEKVLRKLETKMLEKGVIVARTGDDLLRYHGKMMIVDDELYIIGFNYTKLDIDKSRSFGIVTKDPKLIKEATALFEADSTRQPYVPNHDRLVVSPENAREVLEKFISGAKKTLSIYEMNLADKRMVKLLQELRREVTIVLVEHDMNAVFALADRITVLVYGRVIACDVPAAIRQHDEVKRAYLGDQHVVTRHD